MKGAYKDMVFKRETSGLALIFSIGFFALAGQALLFREFLAVFEGNEAGLGCFFASWLVWISAGAALARAKIRLADLLAAHFAWLPLLYVPAGILQWHLLGAARSLAGVEAFELFPIGKMLGMSLLANAPVSLLTGFLFTLACAWFSGRWSLPVAVVYIAESLGGVAGGVWVTLLLYFAYPAESVFLASALLVCLSVALAADRRFARAAGLALCLGCLAALCGGAGRAWARHNDRAAWSRLLPAQTFERSVITPQAKYLMGTYGGQFNVMAGESVVESFPDAEHAAEVVALTLSQKPDARNILVIGPGALSICDRLLALPGLRVTFLHPDPDYAANIRDGFTTGNRARLARLVAPAQDPRAFLAGHEDRYDLVILHIQDPSATVMNRYFSLEFFEVVRSRLSEDGVLAIRTQGAENFMGGGLAGLGASLYATLEKVFKRLALKPGDETWLMASNGADLSEDPQVLRDRFASIEGAAQIYPPEALLSLYIPDRIAFQRRKYREAAAESPPGSLVNTDAHPRAVFFALWILAQQAGMGTVPFAAFRAFADAGFPYLVFLILLVIGLRLAYRMRGGFTGPSGSWICAYDLHFLVASTGFVGMSAGILLLFCFQARAGSLFLQLGLVSALFILGLVAGGWAAERSLAHRRFPPAHLLAGTLILHTGLLLALAQLASDLPGWMVAALFLPVGVFGGAYIPLAARFLTDMGRPDLEAGGGIELWDNLGGAAGGLLTGVVILPLMGTTASFGVLALLTACNGLAMVGGRRAPARAPGSALQRRLNATGYVLFGCAAAVVGLGWFSSGFTSSRSDAALDAAARAMAPGAPLHFRAGMTQTASPVPYYVSSASAGHGRRYVFSTERLAPGVSGYGGPIVLALMTDASGVLQDVRVLRENETPEYYGKIAGWLETFKGRNIFSAAALKDVDGVTGATLTSWAIIETIRMAGSGFARQILGRAPLKSEGGIGDDTISVRGPAFLLAFLLTAALAMRWCPVARSRRFFLVIVLAVAGFFLNAQYSMYHVFSLVFLCLPPPHFSIAFILSAVVPILVLLFGNVYCGHLCPFGAAQELVGELRPRRLNTDPSATAWRLGRGVKYVILFVMLLAAVEGSMKSAVSADPLVAVFAGKAVGTGGLLAMGLLVASFFFRRFFCRNLCPAGAFLSLLNGVRALRRWLPVVYPMRCDLGVQSARDLDCIQCDRCRTNNPAPTLVGDDRAFHFMYAVYAVAVCGFAVLMLSGLFQRPQEGQKAMPASPPALNADPTRPPSPASGESRLVDMERLNDKIRRGELSDREALHYRLIETPP